MTAFLPMDAREIRVLQIAIGASLALHAIALLLSTGIRAPLSAPSLPTLTAVLRVSPAANEPSPVVAPQAARAVEPPRTPVPLRPRPETTPQPVAPAPAKITAASSLPAPAVAAAPSAPVAPGPPPAAETKSAAAPAAAPPLVVASAPPSAASLDPIDSIALQSFKVQLAQFAAKYRRYPSAALEKNWEGIAEVKLTIGSDGRILEAVIGKSSGYDILDKVAIEMVRKAAPLTAIGAGLRNREFSLTLPIVFNIERKRDPAPPA